MRLAHMIVPTLAGILALTASSSVRAQVAPRSREALPPESATTVQPGATLTTVADAAAPADVRPTTVTATRITLAWPAVAGASGYTVARVQNPTGSDYYRDVTTTPLLQPLYADAGLVPGMTYGYQVKALRSDGHYGTSGPVTVTTLAAVNPTNFTGTVNGSDITLRWDPVPEAAFYYLQGDGLAALKVTDTAYTVAGVRSGTYNYALIAYYGPTGVGNEATPARTSVVVKATRGRYRVTLNGFKVERETLDNIFQSDGAGDEVYIASIVQVYSRAQGKLLRSEIVKSAVLGDINGFPDRIQAGNAGDYGGLRRGNSVPNVPNPSARNGEPTPNAVPLLLWQGELVDGETAIAVLPTLWEWDNNATQYRRLGNPDLWAEAALQSKSQTQVLHRIAFESGAYDSGKNSGDRPVGLGSFIPSDCQRNCLQRQFRPSGVLFTREAVEQALAADSQTGSIANGVVGIRYVDLDQLGYTSLGGDYTLYLQVERVP
jgi:hypothetical protein